MPCMTNENSPIEVHYCDLCGLPEDFCRYGPSWEKHPEAKANDESAGDQSSVPKVLPPTVASKSSTGAVIIKIAPRVGRRYLTTISGLDHFDVDISKACKVFAKKFACGVGRKEDTGDIEIQGDVEDSIVATITSNWPNIKARYISIKRKEKS